MVVLLVLVLAGCNNNLNLDKEVTHIEVYDWGSDESVVTIDDRELIEELVEGLDSASTSSTAAMDFEMPDYELHFMHEDEVLMEMGYFEKVMDLGVKGNFIDMKNSKMYQFEMDLPI